MIRKEVKKPVIFVIYRFKLFTFCITVSLFKKVGELKTN